MTSKKNDESNDEDSNSWTNYLGLGTQLAVTVVVMVLLGVWLDGKFSTKPILTVVFSFIGVIGGLYNFIKTTIKSEK